MEKEEYSRYDLIKAILASNLEEDVKEAIVNRFISEQPYYYHYYPYWYNHSDNIGAVAKSTPSVQLYNEEIKK